MSLSGRHRLWPHAQHAEIAHAGYMAPPTHADAVDSIIKAFLMQASERTQVRRSIVSAE